MFSLRNKKKSSLNYPHYPLLSGALVSSVTGLLHNRIMTPNIQEYLSLSVAAINSLPIFHHSVQFYFLCDGQGPVRPAILYADRSCFFTWEQNRTEYKVCDEQPCE